MASTAQGDLQLNKTVPLESYKLYGDVSRVHKITSYDLGIYYLVKVYMNLTGSGSITMTSYEDKVPPSIRLLTMSPREPVLGRPLVLVLEASDTGCGRASCFPFDSRNSWLALGPRP